jgi:integrase
MSTLQLHAPLVGFAPPVYVADVISLYLADAKNNLTKRSFEGRSAALTDFAATFGNVRLADAKPYHLTLWLNNHPQWKSAWTRRGAVAGVEAAFNWGVKLGLIQANPFRGFSCPTGERGGLCELWEYQGMLRGTPPPFRRFIVALRRTGARPGELAKATWADVDFARSCVELREHKTSKATGRSRVIVLDDAMVKLLEWTRRSQGGAVPGALLFPNSYGRKWNNAAICWYMRILRERGLIRATTSLYALRHKLISDLVIAGENMAIIAEIAGHARIQTTMTYVHVGNKTGRLREALGKVFKH